MLQHVFVALLMCVATDGQLFRAPLCSCDPVFQALRNATAKAAEQDDDVFAVTDVFASTSFYIVTPVYRTFDEIVNICHKQNGYLAEINSEEELLFISDALYEVVENKNIYTAYLGTLYEKFDVSAPLKGYTHPDDPLYLGNWGLDGQTRDDLDENWLTLHRGHIPWRMHLDAKRTQYHNVVGLCEVSLNYL